jgi:hypothetical protein
MIISKKAISRRTVLRGLGATISLPLLDSMVPAMTGLAQGPARPVHRFGVVYVPNGMVMENYLPVTQGPGFEMTPTLQGIAPFRERVLVLSGLDCVPTPGRPGGAHAKASTRYLTNISPPTSETWLDAGISVDQILANEMGRETQLASLELAIESSDTAGACDVGFACAYTNTISWRSANTPLPMQHNPRAVFERLFGDSGSTDRRAREARLRQHKSILDSVNDKLAKLRTELGPQDRVKVEQYADAVRDVERRIARAEEQKDVDLPTLDQPQGIPPEFEDHLALMLDLQLLALQSDLTRVVTFMIGKEQSARNYPQVGVPEAHHPLSHHNDVPELIEKMSKINRYHTQLFGGYLAKLRATPDGDGNLLDHMTILYGAGISNSTRHSGQNLPLMLVGGGAGRLAGGRHIAYTNKETNANLLLTLMDKLDVPVEKVGASTGKLDLDTLSGL